MSAADRIFLETTRRYATPKMARDDVRTALQLAQVEPGKPVADLGCGYGRHLRALLEEGHRPIGVDRSPLLLAEAPANAQLVRADLRALPLYECTLAAAFCFYSSMFLGTHDDALAALREAARVLRPNGSLVLTQDNPLRLARNPRAQFQDDVPGLGRIVEESTFDKDENVDRVTKTLVPPQGEPLSATFVIRYYPAPRLLELAVRSGLSLKAVHGDDPDSPQLIALLEKDA